jgi:DNA repair protein RadC
MMTMKKSDQIVTEVQRLAALLIAQAENDLQEQEEGPEQPNKK